MIFSGCNMQNKFLYFPSTSAPSAEALREDNIKFWPSSQKDYRGLVAANDVKQSKGTIIVFHGNGGTAADRTFYIQALAELGYRVIIAEYPMYGGRKGELGEKAFVIDANATVRLAFEQFGEPLFLLGESLGCGVAAAVANQASVKIEGLILITPWNTLTSVAQEKFPFLPIRLLLTDKYDNIGNLKSFKGRICVVGAERDEIIPLIHAHNLYSSLSSVAKRMWIIEKAGHNDWFMYINISWWKEIMDFVKNKDKI